MKKRPSRNIVDVYRNNRDLLERELGKEVQDRSVRNSIAAYQHIVEEMEKTYDLSFV